MHAVALKHAAVAVSISEPLFVQCSRGSTGSRNSGNELQEPSNFANFMPEVVPGSGFTGGYQPMEQFWTRSMWSRQELLRNAVIDAAAVPLFENSQWNGGGDISMRLEFDFWIIRTIRNTEVFPPCNIHCPTLSDLGSLCTLQSSLGNQHAVSLWEGFQMTAKCTAYWLRLP